MTYKDYLTEVFNKEGIALKDKDLERFSTYCHFLKEYNEKVNLTAITEDKEIAVKHFLDSSMVLKLMEIEEGASCIDVGTGAGFPSVPLKILREDLNFTLLDSLNKRLKFLSELLEKLDLKANLTHGRAEIEGINPNLREKFDYSFSRAVASLSSLAEYCLPFVKVGGKMVALKGPSAREEIKEAEKAIKLLGGGNIKVISYDLLDEGKRNLVIIEKLAATNKKYPRQRIKINEHPL